MIFKTLVIALLCLVTFHTFVTMILLFGWIESQKERKKVEKCSEETKND